MSGRQQEAARNDGLILEAARAVFVADPAAPVAAVAKRAGVGMSALYRRYPSKEDLLRSLCGDGLDRYVAVVEAALADDGEPWEAFARFMHAAVDADTSTLTAKLAGTFKPSPDQYVTAQRAEKLTAQVLRRAQRAGVVRADLKQPDLGLIFEQVAAIRLGDEARSRALRRRYLTVLLDGLRAPGAAKLPGKAPTAAELAARWG
jgi:AcrR family transcriptional regulator